MFPTIKISFFHFSCYLNVISEQEGECKTQNITPGHFF